MQTILYQWAFYFFIYAFSGWSAEVAYAALTERRFVNRGFLIGPVCPIYGVGVCLVILCLTPLMRSPVLLYIGAVLLTSVLEFITGYLLERFFHEKWWDYSGNALNIKGYVCLGFSLLWGAGCMVIVYLVQSWVAWLVSLLPQVVGWCMLAVFGAVFVTDIALSVGGMICIRRFVLLSRELEAALKKTSDLLGQHIADGIFTAVAALEKGSKRLDELNEQYGGLLSKKGVGSLYELKEKAERMRRARKTFFANRLQAAFPRLKRRNVFKGFSLRRRTQKTKAN